MDPKEIALFKLLSGEEVIAEYKTDGEFYVFKSPRKVFIAQVGPNQFGVKLAPWIVGNVNGVFPVHSAHVVTVSAEVAEELKTGYISETTGLDLSQTVSTKIIA